LCALWLWLLGRATFAGAPEVTGTRAVAGEEEKGLSSQVADVDYAPED
jgi:hypothetical protein